MNNSITAGEVKITNPKADDLNRIATALERIADALEKENTGKAYVDLTSRLTSIEAGSIKADRFV